MVFPYCSGFGFLQRIFFRLAGLAMVLFFCPLVLVLLKCFCHSESFWFRSCAVWLQGAQKVVGCQSNHVKSKLCFLCPILKPTQPEVVFGKWKKCQPLDDLMVVCHELKQKTAPSLKVFAKNYSWMCNFLGICGKSVHLLFKTHPNVPVAFFDNFYVQSTLALPTQMEITWTPRGNCFNIFQLNPCTKGRGSPLLPRHPQQNAILPCQSALQSNIRQTEDAAMPSQTRTPATHKTRHTTLPQKKQTPATHRIQSGYHIATSGRGFPRKNRHMQNKTKNKPKTSKNMFRKQTKNSEKNPLYCRKRLCQIEEAHGRTTLPHVAYTCCHTCGRTSPELEKAKF